MAAETIKIPGLGPMPRTQVIVGASVTAGIIAYAWWRASLASAGPSVVDPAVDSGGLGGDGPGGGGYDNPAPGAPVPDPTAGTAPRTNAEWSARVSEALAFTFDPGLIQTTVGKYLNRQPLVTSEQLLIRTAWAYVGRPPEGDVPIIPATSTTPTPTPTPAPALPYPSARSPWTNRAIRKGQTITQIARASHPRWTAAQIAALARDAAIQSGYRGRENAPFAAARTIKMR